MIFKKANITVFFLISILLVLALFISNGVNLAEGSPNIVGTNLYLPPETGVPVITTSAVKWTTKPTTYANPTSIISDNEWLLYEDKEGGFSIRYPSMAFLSIGEDINNKYKTVNLDFSYAGSGGYQGMVIDVIDNPKHLSPEEIIDDMYGHMKKPPLEVIKSSLKPVKVGKVGGWKTELAPTLTELTLLVPLENKILLLAPVHGPASINVDEEALKVFYQIVDTVDVAP